MREKYDEVAHSIMSWEGIPAFWMITLFTCSDVEGKKLREDDECLWRLYKDNKAECQNVYNLAVSRTAAQMQHEKVPSGKGMEFWFREIIYQCWCAEQAEPGPVDTSLGGSASKAAAPKDGGDAETRDDSEMTGDGDDDKLAGDAGDGADDKTNKRKAANRSSSAAKKSKKGKTATEGAGEREAPEGYFPKQLLSIAHLGVLSKEPHAQLNWPTAGDTDEEGGKEKAPSRAALRAAAATTAAAKRASLGGSKSGGGGGGGGGDGGTHGFQVQSFIDGQRWGNELIARNSKSAELEQLVKMAKEDDFESDEKHDAAIKEAKAVLSAHRNALREHLRTSQPMPARAPAPAPSPEPPHRPRGEP